MSRYISVLAASVFVCFPALAFAQAAKPLEGTLQIGGKAYNLTHVVAYETKSGDTPRLSLLLTDRAIDAAALVKSVRDNDGSDSDFDIRSPHLKVRFEKGQPKSFFAYASGTNIGGPRGKMEGELKVAEGRASGKFSLAKEGKDSFEIAFSYSFNAPLLGSANMPATQPAAELAKLGVTGKFVGNGKEAKLAFISAKSREPFADKPALQIVMTEKDHSRDPRPEIKAGFGDYGCALIISCHLDGSIFGCQVTHTAHQKKGFSSVGSIETLEFQIAGGQVQGKLRTDGEQEFFGEKWLVDLTFAAKFTPPAGSEPTTKPTTPSPMTTKPVPTVPEVKKPATPRLKARDLVIVQGVEGVDFKKLTGSIKFSSTKNYKVLAAELVKQLATQGWQSDGNDLIGVSAILKRKRGEASLTIFVKPVPGETGSTVQIHSEGLDFDE